MLNTTKVELELIQILTCIYSLYAMSKFLPTGRFKWMDPKKFELNKYSRNSSKVCVLEVDLDYPKNVFTSIAQ